MRQVKQRRDGKQRVCAGLAVRGVEHVSAVGRLPVVSVDFEAQIFHELVDELIERVLSRLAQRRLGLLRRISIGCMHFGRGFVLDLVQL